MKVGNGKGPMEINVPGKKHLVEKGLGLGFVLGLGLSD